MQILHAARVIFICAIAAPVVASSHHAEDFQPGEYYEYDLVGSHKDQARRELTHHTKEVIKAPFKFVQKCSRTTKHALSRALHNVEIFLSDSNSINGKRREFKKAASQFETQAALNDYYVHDDEKGQCLFGFPAATWKAFKRSLYMAGFQFPRFIWRGMKSAFRGVCTCVTG